MSFKEPVVLFREKFSMDDDTTRRAMKAAMESGRSPPGVAHAESLSLFYELWTKVAGSDGYDKQQWLRMEELLLSLRRRASQKGR